MRRAKRRHRSNGAQKHGDDGIEEEVNFSVQNSSSRCQIGIDVKHHSLIHSRCVSSDTAHQNSFDYKGNFDELPGTPSKSQERKGHP